MARSKLLVLILLCAAAGGSAAALIELHKPPAVPLASGNLLVPRLALADFTGRA